MKKKDLVKKLKALHEQGIFGAPLRILDIFEEDEEVPADIELLMTEDVFEKEPRELICYFTPAFHNAQQRILKDYWYEHSMSAQLQERDLPEAIAQENYEEALIIQGVIDKKLSTTK